MDWAIRAGALYTPEGVIKDGGLLIERGRIARLGRWAELMLPQALPVRDLRPHSLVPGLIDLHIHGAAGADFMDGDDDAFEAICAWHARGGTTALLATTCTAPIETITGVLERVERWQRRDNQGARVLGAHVEGPFFNMQMRGCHLPEYVRAPTRRDLDQLLEHRAALKHLTIAPEIEGGLAAIERLAAQGVSLAIAHSDATSEQVDAAIQRGLRHVTHLYNAMSVYHRRGPERISGVVETALVRDELTVELIADGLHVNPTRLTLAARAKGTARVCLVSDAMRGAGMPDGLYAFGPRSGKGVLVSHGRAVMPEGSGYASSTVGMIDCVRIMCQQAGVALAEALAMASSTPAQVLGIADRKGALRPGLDADILVLDQECRVLSTIVEGRVVYETEAVEQH